MRLSELNDGKVPLRIRRLTTPDTLIPASPALQRGLLPTEASIEKGVRTLCSMESVVGSG
jgi:hypothetical protein